MRDADMHRLGLLAEQAMRDEGFQPLPPADALAEAGQAAPAPGPGVQDLRGLPWTSIDNPESRDLDQIEVTEALPGGRWRLRVGIADVTAHVRQAGPIDRFAAHNATSVYTGVRTFPMLPEGLSYDRTSLLADRDRLAWVIETEVDADGTIGRGDVRRAWTRNQAKLDYPSVSAWLDGKGPVPPPLRDRSDLQEQVRMQDELAVALAQGRKRAGALDVDTAETRAVLDAEGRVTGLAVKEPLRAALIVEELMIASNRTVARTLDAAGLPSLRRIVREPERWARIVRWALDLGTQLPTTPDSRALAGLVDRLRKENSAEDFGDLSLALVKLIGRGEYVAFGKGRPEPVHFGLATTEYTHATAPNRRYADLATQRLLLAHVSGAGAPYTLDELDALAQHCSHQESQAHKVERRVKKSAAAVLLAPRIGHEFRGVVTGSSAKGVYARVTAPPVEGRVTQGAEGLEVGDRVRLRLLSVSVDQGFLDFACVGRP